MSNKFQYTLAQHLEYKCSKRNPDLNREHFKEAINYFNNHKDEFVLKRNKDGKILIMMDFDDIIDYYLEKIKDT